jgi:23S rRNA (uracil1939-C5)-methyltransferase
LAGCLNVKSVDIAEVEVRGLAAGGSGVGDLPDGRVIFTPRTAPGDLASVRIVKSKKRWAGGEVESLIRASPDRVDPPCRLYDQCGGCTLQHIRYEDQLLWKGRFVADALQRIGGVAVDAPSVEPSELETGYRNRVTFTLRRLRSGRVVAGFHALGRPSRIVEVWSECLLPEEPIRQAWADLRAAWGPGARLLPMGGRLSLTLRGTDDGVVLVVEGGQEGWNARDLAEATPSVRAFWHRPTRGTGTVLVAGEPAEDSWGPDRFSVEGRAFLQVNRSTGARLIDHVVAQAGDGSVAIDAYCGVGLYGRALARGGWTVTGIEADPAACRAARSDTPTGLTIRQDTVERALAGALPADVVILNPPRTGLHASVAPILIERGPGRVIYVSCDPATLARDTAALQEKYEIEGLTCFDLFPQTAHVETVAVFGLRGGS